MGEYYLMYIISDTRPNREKLENLNILQHFSEQKAPFLSFPLNEDFDSEDMVNQYRTMLTTIFGEKILVFFDNKRDKDSKLRALFETNDWYEAENNFQELMERQFDSCLAFGNDDLNGWEIAIWKVPKSLEPLIIKSLAICWIALFDGKMEGHRYKFETEENVLEIIDEKKRRGDNIS